MVADLCPVTDSSSVSEPNIDTYLGRPYNSKLKDLLFKTSEVGEKYQELGGWQKSYLQPS